MKVTVFYNLHQTGSSQEYSNKIFYNVERFAEYTQGKLTLEISNEFGEIEKTEVSEYDFFSASC